MSVIYPIFFFWKKKYRHGIIGEKCGAYQDRDDIPNHETRESNLGTKYFLKIKSLRMSTGLSDI